LLEKRGVGGREVEILYIQVLTHLMLLNININIYITVNGTHWREVVKAAASSWGVETKPPGSCRGVWRGSPKDTKRKKKKKPQLIKKIGMAPSSIDAL